MLIFAQHSYTIKLNNSLNIIFCFVVVFFFLKVFDLNFMKTKMNTVILVMHNSLSAS